MTDSIGGNLFSRNYINVGSPTSDSASARLRICAFFFQFYHESFVKFLRVRRGLAAPPYPAYEVYWDSWFEKLAIIEFLDVVTVIYNWLESKGNNHHYIWIDFVKQVFQEENIRYRVDELCGVHFSVDNEFERNQVSTISALKMARYGSASAHFNAAQQALDAIPPQTRDAIRQTFECVETLFKLMFPNENLLGGSAVIKRVKPLAESRAKSETERAAAGHMAESLKSWVLGAHNYRHAAGSEEPDNPPVDFAVLNVSMGASFARWLAEIDTEIQSASS